MFFIFRSVPRDPLQQNFLVIQSNGQFYLIPMQGPYEFVKDGKSKIVETPHLSPEVKSNVEVVDKSAEKSEEMGNKDGKDDLNLASEIQNKYNKNLKKKMWRKYDKNCNLRDHTVVQSNVCPYECGICGLRLTTETLFKSHISLHESDMKDLFYCEDCDFKSTKASSLKCHQIKCHAKIYKCQFCSKLFQNKVVFLKHVELHTMCGQVCEYNNLTQHKQQDDKSIYNQREDECQNDEKHAIKKYEPEKFNLQEYNNNNLNGFNRDSNLLKKKKFFKCSHCRWSFKTMNLLNKHTKRHSTFKCNECDAVFKYKASFLNHKYKHKNEN